MRRPVNVNRRTSRRTTTIRWKSNRANDLVSVRPQRCVRAGYGRRRSPQCATAGTPPVCTMRPVPDRSAQPARSAEPGIPHARRSSAKTTRKSLYWLYDQKTRTPPISAAARPAIYSNYDFTYQHQFANGMAMKSRRSTSSARNCRRSPHSGSRPFVSCSASTTKA